MSKDTLGVHRDVIIIGAGVSGIGAACHLQRECPNKSFLILEGRNAIGGTWDLFRYPGIRSDSDLLTYQYDFKPWQGQSIATAEEILSYLHEVVDEYSLEPQIRFGHYVTSASWSSEDALWRIEALNKESETCFFTANFLFMCQGYFNHQAGYRPEFKGEAAFKGLIVHPQQWPENLDYKAKKMVVIGSGATAATIVPAVADHVAHVTQLQRSPSYYLPFDTSEDDFTASLRALELPEEWIHEIRRRKSLAEGRELTERSLNEPDLVKQELLAMAAEYLPADYPLEPHFSPNYDPWKERLCLLPDGDLFKAIASGKASMVTDVIDCFVEDGIQLVSGEVLKADIIVCATGIELCGLGNIPFFVDNKPVSLPDTWTYRGIMISDLPNLAWSFGYIRSSWTLRSDLIAHFVCRLLNHMDAINVRQCTPILRAQDASLEAKPFIDSADFAPGYLRRGAYLLPKQGDCEPWVNSQNYYLEKDILPAFDFDDGVLEFKKQGFRKVVSNEVMK